MEQQTGLGELSVREWADERLANTMEIAATKHGADRESWLEDMRYWAAIKAELAEVQSLRAERDLLAQQVAEMVAPEELRQWKAVADALRLEMHAQEDRANTAEGEAQQAEAERDTLREAATKQLWELRELFHAQVQAFRDVATEQAGPTRWCARRRADDWQKAADMLGQRLLALGLFTRVSPQTAEETQGSAKR